MVQAAGASCLMIITGPHRSFSELHPMHRALLLLLSTGLLQGLHAQDSLRMAPRWVGEFLLGVGDGEHVQVRTGPDETDEIDLAGWFNLGFAVERRVAVPWSVRGTVAYESGGWEGHSPANPYATPNSTTDRWAVGAYAVHQLHRGKHSQYTVYAGAHAVFGMNIQTDHRTDTAWVRSSFQQVDLHYKPALVPQAGLAWRWQFREKPEGLMLRAGVEYATYTYKDAELSSGLSTVPADLAPLQGTHAGWAYTIAFGLYLMP